MKKRLHFILSLSVFLFVFIGYGQSSKLNNLMDAVKQAGLNKDIVTEIHELLLLREEKITAFEKLEEERKNKYEIIFQDDELTKEFVDNEFRKSLSELITTEEFKKNILSTITI